MKSRYPHRQPRSRRGSAVVGVMILTLITAGVSFALLSYASHSLQLTRRSLEYQKVRAAAEAGLDYGVSQLLTTMRTYQFSLDQASLQTYLDALPSPPAFSNAVYTTPASAPAFRITVENATQTGTISQGFAAVGSEGQHQQFTISCGARNPNSGVAAVVKERVQAISVYLNRYGVFYQEDLEIDPGPNMDFYGPVHANGDLYVDGPIDFHDRITAFGNIFHRRKDDGSHAGGVYIENDAAALVSMTESLLPIDSDHQDWMTESLNRWDGRVLDRAHAVPYLTPPYNPLSSAHDMVEQTLPTNHVDYAADTEAAKLINNAALIIEVSALGVVTVTDYFGTDLSGTFSPATVKTNLVGGVYENDRDGAGKYNLDVDGSYDTTQTFFDGREGAVVAPVDIYVEKLVAAYPSIHSGTTYGVNQGRGVVYVIREDPDGAGGILPAVRLRNGKKLPTSGLTFASDLPIYIDGDYNTDSGGRPAMVAGDAVTLLSADWQDVHSTSPLASRVADNTTYNAVIMTGNYATVPAGNYNGGLENVLRFLEDWTGKTATYRGSIIDLWFSETASGLWGAGYYSPPYRDWGYDIQYRTAAPPGAPRVFAVEQLLWSETTWAAEGW